jgi:hypothetical protein
MLVDLGVQLLDLKTHPAGHAFDERGLGLQARPRHPHELPEALDDGALLLLNGEKEDRHVK